MLAYLFTWRGRYLTCAAAAYYAYCGAVPENAVDAWPGHWAPGVVARLGLTLQV